MCVFLTSSSQEICSGIKEGFISFTGHQHASFTYITTYVYNNNINISSRVCPRMWERERERESYGALI